MDARTQFEEHMADPWNEELERSRKILKNFLEAYLKKIEKGLLRY